MKRLAFLMTLLIPVFAFSQITFEKVYGDEFNDYATAVRQTYDDGFIIVGSSVDTVLKILLMKTNVHGDTLWTKRYGKISMMETASWEGYDVQQTLDSGYIVVGIYSDETSSSMVYLAKADKEGNLSWSNVYAYMQGDTVNNHNSGFAVQQTSDSGFIIVGSTDHTVWDFGRIYLIKTDVEGNVQWQNIFKGSFGTNSSGQAIKQMDDDGYLIGGETQYNFGNPFIALLVRTDELGDTVWTKLVGDSYSEVKAIQKVDSNKYLIGVSGGGMFNESLYTELLIIDSNGNVLWSKRYNFGIARGTDMQRITDTNYIVCGEIFDAQYYTNMFLFKANSSGDSIWFNEFGGVQNDMSASVRQTNDGGFILAGFTYSYGSGGEDVYLIKTNGDGIMTWSKEYSIEKGLNTNLYPNPFTTSTTIEYTLNFPQTVQITFYDSYGRAVDQINQHQQKGLNKIVWTPKGLNEGIYYFRLVVGKQVVGRKVVNAK